MQFLADLCSSFVRKQPNKEQKKKLLHCCIPVRLRICGAEPGSIERASLRYATKHVRGIDSDYVMKKPSRCWLGAVPRYWKVVPSCFQIVRFAGNTSAPLAPRGHIFQRILLLFFFVFLLSILSTKRCPKLFFIPSQNLKEDKIWMVIFGRFQILNQLLVRNLKFGDMRKDIRSKLK